jgi:hypothetical protein
MNHLNQAHPEFEVGSIVILAEVKQGSPPATQPSGSLDPSLVKTVLEHSSPIVVIVLMIWLFKVLTQFVRVCKDE